LGSWRTSDADSLFYGPALYSQEEQVSWEAYAVANQINAGIGIGIDFALAGIDFDSNDVRPISNGIFRLDDEYFPIDDDEPFTSPTNDIKVPLWQINPSAEKRHLNMFNLNSLEGGFMELLRTTKMPQFTPIMEQEMADFFLRDGATVSGPRSLVMLPIVDTVIDEMVAITGAEIDWITYFEDVLSLEGHKTDIVLTNTCSPSHTYQVTGTIAVYRGEGDLHDSKYDSHGQTTTLEELSESTNWEHYPVPGIDDVAEALGCIYSIAVYPTQEYESIYLTSWPIVYTLVVAALTLLAVSLFVIYVYLADRRQRQVLDSAAKSNAIIKSLFPAVVRDRLFGGVGSTHSNAIHPGTARRRKTMASRGSNAMQHVPLNTDDHHGNHLLNPKIRLTNFLTSSSPTDVEHLMHHQQEDEPIAEMFSNTTVVRIIEIVGVAVSFVIRYRMCFSIDSPELMFAHRSPFCTLDVC
jgi:hypothetical protein